VALIEINLTPSRRELRIFSLAPPAMAGLLIWLALRGPGELAVASGVPTGSWLISLAFNDELARRRQLLGVLTPAVLAGVFGLVRTGTPDAVIITALAAVGVGAGVGVWLSGRFGRGLYVGWMTAALPVGWAISFLLMVVVYYLVVTPVGLVLRAVRGDPMCRKFDPEAESYWIESKTTGSVERYFRQF